MKEEETREVAPREIEPTWEMLMPLIEAELKRNPNQETISRVLMEWGSPQQCQEWEKARTIAGKEYPAGYLTQFAIREKTDMSEALAFATRSEIQAGSLESLLKISESIDGVKGLKVQDIGQKSYEMINIISGPEDPKA